MIELSCIGELNYYERLILLSAILRWLSEEIAKKSEKLLYIHGSFLIVNSQSREASMIILPDENSEKDIMLILQQPPGEFNGKYIAKIPSEEPTPVVPAMEETILKDDESIPT